jgi:hypothetical protein
MKNVALDNRHNMRTNKSEGLIQISVNFYMFSNIFINIVLYEINIF